MKNMGVLAEEIKKREDTANVNPIYSTCLTNIAYRKEDDYIAYCFLTDIKRKKLPEQWCNYPTCMNSEKMNFLTAYYYLRDIEMKQKTSIAEAVCPRKKVHGIS